MSKERFDQRIADITSRSQNMEEALCRPVVDEATGAFISDDSAQEERLTKAVANTVYEGLGDSAPMVLATHSRAVQGFCNNTGRMPDPELLASAHASIENTIKLFQENEKRPGGIYESADLNTSEGVLMRDRMIALILPVMLQSITSNMVTFIPGQYNQSEMFRVRRKAGSNFGGLTKGEYIDYDYSKSYSCMDQIWQAPDGNGTATGSSNEFKFDSNAVYSTVYPLKPKRVKIMHDHDIVATDNGSGQIFGAFEVGGTPVTVTGTVNYDTGVIDPVFSVAPAAGIEVHIGFDVDIETDPTLIPKVTHDMQSELLYPHEGAITADTTLQALWAMRREYNLNADNLAMQAMRNLLSADKDRKHLSDMYFYAKGSTEWDATIPAGTAFRDHYETVKRTLLEIDTLLVNQTGFSGLVGLVADPSACAILRSLPSPYFTAAANYRKMAQPHYVGRLFGMWDLYEDPGATKNTALCFAKGANHGEAGYVAGDAIAPLSFKHPTLTDLVYRNTLWELSYRDLNPFYGRKCFTKLVFTES